MTAEPQHQPVTAEEADRAFQCLERFETLLVAVSGGPDSLALLYLVAEWAKRKGRPAERLYAATVDHKLRAESATEAALVAEHCARLGVAHAILSWDAQKPWSGLMEGARRARYALLAGHLEKIAGAESAAAVTAHTLDDQAETLIMRLKRGSGVDGLAAIPVERPLSAGPDLMLVRPLLAFEKTRLIATLQVRGALWCDDPTNDDTHYERVRVRRLMQTLQQSGVTAEALARTARRMGEARDGLAYGLAQFKAGLLLNWNHGVYAQLNRTAFDAGPRILRQMVLTGLIEKSGGASAAPELSEIEALAVRLETECETGVTLGGAMVRTNAKTVRVWREAGRLSDAAMPLQRGERRLWDDRFWVSYDGDADTALCVAPLGAAGYQAIASNIAEHLRPPASAAHALPAFFAGGALLAVPLLGVMPDALGRDGAGFKGLRLTCDPTDG